MPYINLLNQILIYVQHAPVPVQASLLSPAKFASIINQLSNGGDDLIITNIINNDKKALKLFVLICLFNKSKLLIPEYSILIKCNPIKPKTNGKRKLMELGKNPVKFKLKNEFKETSKILKENKKIPEYKNVYKFSLLGDKIFILFIIFL
tara:strand:+ start:247 stop:696 length:450 start_codon:yes stop_codon:yes gene_type:complete